MTSSSFPSSLIYSSGISRWFTLAWYWLLCCLCTLAHDLSSPQPSPLTSSHNRWCKLRLHWKVCGVYWVFIHVPLLSLPITIMNTLSILTMIFNSLQYFPYPTLPSILRCAPNLHLWSLHWEGYLNPLTWMLQGLHLPFTHTNYLFIGMSV